MILKYTALWIGLVIIAIINGTIREVGYRRFVGELPAHQVSSITFIILIGIYTWLWNLKWRIESSRQSIAIGLIWLTLTIAFEFLFGHYVMKHPWSRLFHDYNLLKGRVWALVLLWTAIAPYVIFKLRS